jgi:hypothetical protein
MAVQMTQSKNPAAGGPQVTTSSINGEDTPPCTPPAFPDSAWRGVLAPYYNLVSETTEAADSFIWGAAVAMLSVLTSAGVALPWGAQLMRPVVFLCLLGVTGRTRKSTAIQDARQLILEPLLPRPSFPGEPEQITVVSGFGSGEGMADALADRDYWPPGKKKGEHPPEKMIGRRALFEIDEFGAQLAKANKDAAGNFIGFMLRLWDCTPSLSQRTRREQMNATGALGTVIAASTYSHLGSTLNADLVHHGLLNRFILLHGEPGKPLPVRPPIDLQEHAALLAELQQALSAVWGKPFTIHPDAEAVHAYHYNQDHSRPRESDLLEAATNRAQVTAMRLALLFAAIRGATVIDAGDMQAAWDVMHYNRSVVASLLQRMEASSWRDVEDRVLARARRVGERYAGTFSKDEVRAGLKGGNGLDARTFSMAWDGLLRAGDIIPVTQGSDRYRIHEGGQS